MAQMVERYLGVVEVARSNRVTQTKHDQSERFGRVFFFRVWVRFHASTYASHTKSCLLLVGRTRRA